MPSIPSIRLRFSGTPPHPQEICAPVDAEQQVRTSEPSPVCSGDLLASMVCARNRNARIVPAFLGARLGSQVLVDVWQLSFLVSGGGTKRAVFQKQAIAMSDNPHGEVEILPLSISCCPSAGRERSACLARDSCFPRRSPLVDDGAVVPERAGAGAIITGSIRPCRGFFWPDGQP